VRLAARVIPGRAAVHRNRCELSGPGWQAGAIRPREPSPLPVRPLRLSPKTATAGGRPTATPGHRPAPVGRRHALPAADPRANPGAPA
jgi:hypothetical protein